MAVDDVAPKTYADKVEHLHLDPAYPIDQIVIGERLRPREDLEDVEELGKLSDSTSKVGMAQCILVDEDGLLVCGERRIVATKRKGETTIPAVVCRRMMPEVRRAVEHAENFDRTHLNWRERGVWREASMEANRRMYPSWTQNDEADASGISQKQVSRELKIGRALKVAPELLEDCRTQEEAEKVLDNLEERVALVKAKEKVPDKVKNAPKGASDHFRIGDAVEKMQLEPDESVDFAEVDPPYGVKLDIHKKGTANIETYTEWSEKEYEERLPIVAREVYRLLKNDSYAVFWYGTKHHCLTLRILKEAGFKIDPIPCIWVKGKVEDVLKSGYAAAPNYNFATCYETFFMVRKGSAMLPLNDGQGHGRGRSNVFHSPPDPEKNHATGKPLGLMLEVLQSIVRIPGSTVLVPFLGSGVTLRAAYQLGHTGFGWDLSEEHREKFLRRVADDEKARSDEYASNVVEDGVVNLTKAQPEETIA